MFNPSQEDVQRMAIAFETLLLTKGVHAVDLRAVALHMGIAHYTAVNIFNEGLSSGMFGVFILKDKNLASRVHRMLVDSASDGPEVDILRKPSQGLLQELGMARKDATNFVEVTVDPPPYRSHIY